jgi:GTPase SAR1 family protein
MKQQIKIIVAGQAGSGKTTIANHLKTFLTIAGFTNVELNDINPPLKMEDAAKRFAHMVADDSIEFIIEAKNLKVQPFEPGSVKTAPVEKFDSKKLGVHDEAACEGCPNHG